MGEPVSLGVGRPEAARRDERGFVAGADGLIFGVAVFVLGSLVILNLWALIEARNTANSVAREYLRAYTEAPDADTAAVSASMAGDRAFDASSGDLWSYSVDAPSGSTFGPCAPATVTVQVRVPGIAVPVIRGVGAREIEVTRTELIDPYRGLTRGPSYERAGTPCE